MKKKWKNETSPLCILCIYFQEKLAFVNLFERYKKMAGNERGIIKRGGRLKSERQFEARSFADGTGSL